MTAQRIEVLDQSDTTSSAIDGIFVVGMFASGLEVLDDALSCLGLRSLSEVDHPSLQTLAELNRRLLAVAGDPPTFAPLELARSLEQTQSAEEARRVLETALKQAEVYGPGSPWVWADWRLSFLASYWTGVAALRPAVILIHRDPGGVASATVPESESTKDRLGWWDRCNRSALALCSKYPSLVVSYRDFVGQPNAVLTEIVKFLADLGVTTAGELDHVVARLETLVPEEQSHAAPEDIDPNHRTLDRVLEALDGRRGEQIWGSDGLAELTEVTADFYGENYYEYACDKGGVPYSRSEPFWLEFFGSVAEQLVKTLEPGSVLDVGCALGLLVEALRSRGVDARGIDISAWAIEQVPAHLRPSFDVASVTEELQGQYDLITCIEVLEHLPPSLAEAAVANLCRHAQTILFSSTPDDFEEPTHLNVQPGGYWAGLFFQNGFVRDFDYDASFLSPQAILFRQGSVDEETLIDGYERALWRRHSDLNGRLVSAVREHDRLAERFNQAAVVHDELSSAYQDLQASSAEVVAIRNASQEQVRHLSETVDNAERRRAAESAAAYEMVHQFELGQRRLAGDLAVRDAELLALRNTKTFRYSAKLRGIYGLFRRRRAPADGAGLSILPADGTYQMWIDFFDTRDDAARLRLEKRVHALVSPPKISVIMPVYNPPVDLLRSAIDSVRNQIYPNWELCISDDCSTDPAIAPLLEEVAATDDRIKVVRREVNGHISAASNSSLAIATGEWIAPLDHDDLLADHALALVALTISEHSGAGLLYSDEDKVDESGQRRDPFFKPDFDPLLLEGQNYICHLSVFRKDLVDRVGGYRQGLEGSQDWDLTLRISEFISHEQVVHIPHVLYHWRAHRDSTASLVSTKPYAMEAGRRAVEDHLNRIRRSARVVRMGRLGHNRIIWDLREPVPRVTIIVPTRDGRLLQRCLDSVLDFTQYPNFDVVVVDNSSRTFPTLSWLQGNDDRITVIRDERPFNYAAINNSAVQHTSGEVICLLNDDTEVISGEWLTEMVSQLMQPGVGAVGSKLHYGDGRIQHAGVILGIGGVAGHAHRMADRASVGYFGNLQLAHRVSAVTAACAVVRREAWDQIGGLDEVNLPVAFNDVDLCLRLREAGWEIVWTPYAQLWHHESISRGPDDQGPRAGAFAEEVLYMEKRWGFEKLREDRYYNPNLTLNAENFSLAWPPRASYDSGL